MSNPVKISEFNYREGKFTRNNQSYFVPDLIEAAKDLPEFDLPLEGIDIGVMAWGELSMGDFVYHVRRMNAATVDHAIILDNTGYICDGWHRVCKAMLEGKKTIKAKRLIVMPDPVDK